MSFNFTLLCKFYNNNDTIAKQIFLSNKVGKDASERMTSGEYIVHRGTSRCVCMYVKGEKISCAGIVVNVFIRKI